VKIGEYTYWHPVSMEPNLIPFCGGFIQFPDYVTITNTTGTLCLIRVVSTLWLVSSLLKILIYLCILSMYLQCY